MSKAYAIGTSLAVVSIAVAAVVGLGLGYSFVAAKYTPMFPIAAAPTTTVIKNQTATLTTTTTVVIIQNVTETITSTITTTTTSVSTVTSVPANLVGSFSYSNNLGCGIFIPCTYAINGAYSNVGTQSASSASVNFTFWSGSRDTGQILCATTVSLGTVSGQTITSMPEATCSSSSASKASSFSWSFSWS